MNQEKMAAVNLSFLIHFYSQIDRSGSITVWLCYPGEFIEK